MQFGHFDDMRKEYVIDTPATPLPWINYLGNEDFFGLISNTMGGLSGPAVLPVAVRMVYQVRQAVKVPILGMGGISSGRDVVEMMLAGADAVSIGAALFRDPLCPVKALAELKSYLNAHHIENASALSGGVLL